MKLFSQKETQAQNIAFIGIMSSINVTFVLLTSLSSLFLVFLVFLLTLTSTLVGLFTKKRFFPIYLLATLSLCFFISRTDTLFFIFPSLLVGYIFSLAYKGYLSMLLGIIISTIVLIALTYLSIPIIYLITGRDYLNDLMNIVKLANSSYLSYFRLGFVTLISFIQILLSFLFLNFSGVSKWFIEKYSNNFNLIEIIVGFISLALIIVFSFVKFELSLLLLFISFVIAINILIKLTYKQSIINLVVMVVALIITLVINGICFKLFTMPKGLILLSIFPFLILSYNLFIKVKEGLLIKKKL